MTKRKIILSSGNAHKVEEIKHILKDLPLEIVTKNDLGLKDFDVVEDADTLEGNAFKKAEELSKLVHGIVIADDTGLFVDALNGAPGVYTARFAGEGCSYEDNNRLMLEKLKGLPPEKRTAHFKTVIAMVLEDGTKIKAEGICNGRIAESVRGDRGFGYDPLFIVDGYENTFAEMPEEFKNTHSHRAKALQNLRSTLEELLK